MIIPRTETRARRRPLSRMLAGLAAAVLALTVAVAGDPSPATAAAPTPESDGTVELELTLGEFGVLPANTPLSGKVTIENGLAESLSAGRVALEINRTALTDQAAISTWLNAGTAADAFATVFSAPSAVVPSRIAAETTVFVTAPALQLPVGVYPVRTTLTGATSDDGATAWDLTVRSVLTVSAGAAAPVGLLVPITATPQDGAMLTADELDVLTAADGALAAQLDAVEGTAAVLAIDPAILAAIRALGSAAPKTAQDWLDRWNALPNERFALQFGDADAAVQAQAGFDSLLQPTTLSTYLDAENFIVPADPTPSPTPSATDDTDDTDDTVKEPGAPLPDDTELTQVDGALEGLLWPRGDVRNEDLATFATFVGGATTTILPSSATDATGARAQIADTAVLVTDTPLSALFSAAAAEPDAAARGALLAEANAALALSGSSASGILIGLDRDETRSAAALSEVAAAAGAGPLRLITALPAASATLTTDVDTAKATQLNVLLDDEQSLDAFATILDEPQVLLGPERIRLLRVIGVGLSGADYDAAYAAHRTRTTTTLNAVSLQESGPIQLFSANVALPVWIRNDLPWPVNLTLEVVPSDPRIAIEQFTVLQAVAGNNTKVTIPVEARVASGELRVDFSLTSPTGVAIGAATNADVTVRAEWEGIGLGILGSVIALLLVFGVVRTVRRRRRATVTAAETDAGADTVSEEEK